MKKVLVVDDEKEIADLLGKALKKHRYLVRVANSGEEALALCQTGGKVDLMLLDIAMPGIDGYQTCQALRNDPKLANIPVIFLTGKDLDPDSLEKHMQELGVHDYIPKPSTVQEMLDKVKEFFEKQKT
ncbi:MAG: response regulator [Candidatus Omnitrophica bacterium]|nr:response regulator [Candidatus Omnitrophota bacterium]